MIAATEITITVTMIKSNINDINDKIIIMMIIVIIMIIIKQY